MEKLPERILRNLERNQSENKTQHLWDENGNDDYESSEFRNCTL